MVGKEFVRAMGAVLTDDSAAVPACGPLVGRFRALSAGHCVWRAWSSHVVITTGDSIRLTQATRGKGVRPLAN